METNNPASSTDLDAVLRRVGKLLAISGDERANPAEAAAAAGQAEKIMRKYQIDHADIISASAARDDSFDQQDIGGTMNPYARAMTATTWAGMLGLAIAKLNDCRSSWARSAKLGLCLRYSGFKSDTQVCLFTHLYIVNQMVMALRTHQKECGSDRSQSESFRKGFIVAVCRNLAVATEDKKQEMSQAVNSRELVLVKSGAVSERFGEQRVKHTAFRQSGDSYSEGFAAGRKVDIGRRGVTGQASHAQIS